MMDMAMICLAMGGDEDESVSHWCELSMLKTNSYSPRYVRYLESTRKRQGI